MVMYVIASRLFSSIFNNRFEWYLFSFLITKELEGIRKSLYIKIGQLLFRKLLNLKIRKIGILMQKLFSFIFIMNFLVTTDLLE